MAGSRPGNPPSEPHRDSALNEMVGAIVLIGIITAGAGLISVALLSDPLPDRVPALILDLVSTQSDPQADFSHQGGEPLQGSQTTLMAFDADRNPVGEYTYEDLYLSRHEPGGVIVYDTTWKDLNKPFTYGETLRIPAKGDATFYHLIYRAGSGEYLIRKIGYGSASSSTLPSCSGVDAGFSIASTGRTFTFTPNVIYDEKDGYRWGWTISGKDFLKSFTNTSITETFPVPAGTSGISFTIMHWVAQYKDGNLVCQNEKSRSVYVTPTFAGPLVPDFSWRYSSDGVTVFFTDLSEGHNPGQNHWEFTRGDPAEYDGEQPGAGVLFSGPGPYYATLTVNGTGDREGQKASVTREIAGPLCVVSTLFTWDNLEFNSSTSEYETTFYWDDFAAGVHDKEYELIWDFGDTHQLRRDKSDWTGQVEHSFTQPGNYLVSLTVKSHGCPDYRTERIISTSSSSGGCSGGYPTACFTLDPTYQADGTIQVIVNGTCSTPVSPKKIIRWEWDFGDGTPLVIRPNGENVTHTYAANNALLTHPITLRVVDDSACDGTVTKTVTSQCPDLTADFTNTTLSPYPYQVRFDATPSTPGVTSWEWSFGDGETSTLQAPVHTYADLIPHTVHLRVKLGSCTDEITRTILPPCPVISPGFNLRVIDSTHIEVTDTSTLHADIAAWTWDFGDGKTPIQYTQATYQPVTQYTYATAGDAVITLTIENRCGEKQILRRSLSCPLVDPVDFTADPTTGDAPLDVDFHPVPNPDVVRWVWNFGDGTTEERTTAEPVPHTFRNGGNYTVSLTAINDCGASGRKEGTVRAVCPLPDASFSYTRHVDLAAGTLRIDFTDTSPQPDRIQEWRWDFGDRSQVIWNRTQWAEAGGAISHQYPGRAPYTATLTVSSICGSSDHQSELVYNLSACDRPLVADFIPLSVQEYAPGTISFTDLTPGAVQWNWNFGDGFSSEEQHPTHRFNRSGNYSVTLTAVDECGNTGTKTGIVRMICPDVTADFGYEYLAADRIAKNLTVRFTDASQGYGTPITWWSWDFGDGNRTSWTPVTRPADGSVINQYPETAPYSAVLEVENECGHVDRIHKLVYNGSVCDPILANFTPLFTDGTAPLTVNFIDTSTGDPNRWHWDFGDGSFGLVEQNATVTRGDISHTYALNGTYQVKLVATGECGRAGVKSGTVNAGCADVSIDFRYVVNNPESDDPLNVSFFITEPSDPAVYDTITEWTWLFDDGTVSHDPAPTHLYPGRQQYHVLLFAKNNCGKEGKNERVITLVCPTLIPDFEVSPDTGFVPLSVDINDNSTPNSKIIRWRWFFGDGGYYSTTDQIHPEPPSHTYTAPGRYNITLSIENECTQYFTTNRTVLVRPVYFINATADTGGSISPAGITTVREGESQAYTIVPDTCRKISDVLIDGFSNGSISQYEFTNVTANHTIHAIFDEVQYNITAHAGPGGNISPEGKTVVPCGGDQGYTITPFSCHQIQDVTVDGVSQGRIGSYIFAGVFADHLINATFERIPYNLTATADAGGTIDPAGVTTILCGDDRQVTITADPCYNISNVMVNGASLGPQTSPFLYSFTNITADQTIHATFTMRMYNITATAGSGGSISPSGTIPVPCGQDQSFTITNNTCFTFSDLVIDGVSTGMPTSPYVFPNLQADHTIDAVFTPRGPFTITSSSVLMNPDGTYSPNPGRITPEGTISVPCGESRTYTMTSEYNDGNTDYVLVGVYVDGSPVGVINPYTFSSVQEDHTIVAVYTTKCQRVTGMIVNETGAPVGGLRVELYDRPGTTFIRYTISQPDGTYVLPAPVQNALRFSVKLPNVVSQPTWTSTSSSLRYPNSGNTGSGTGEWLYNFLINQAAQCNAIIDWEGVGVSR